MYRILSHPLNFESPDIFSYLKKNVSYKGQRCIDDTFKVYSFAMFDYNQIYIRKKSFFFAETSEIKQFEKWEKINRYIIKDYYIKLIFN